VSLTDAGLELRPGTPVALLISDGIVEQFMDGKPGSRAGKKTKADAAKRATAPVRAEADISPAALTAAGERVAARLREWRTAEAKRLGVPPFMVLHERTLLALAAAQPKNPNEMLRVDGIGPAKVERFGEAILGLCAGD
jgi:superfamily II DNA helicase RecQ